MAPLQSLAQVDPPRAPLGKYPLNDTVRGVAYSALSVEDTFTKIYATDAWGKGSGAGSVPVHCLKWIEFVRQFIRKEKIESVVDLGCGDWQFSPYIYHDLNVNYTGYDVVLPVIEANRRKWADQAYRFEHLEFSTHVPEIRDADLYILKDVLQHWSSARVSRFLNEVLTSKPSLRFVLLCNCAEPEDWPEDDIGDGGWRPLFAGRSPLREFSPTVLMQFPSLPNKKEVCLLRPFPSTASLLPAPIVIAEAQAAGASIAGESTSAPKAAEYGG
eukprot:CAMPEP_0113820062 /NCGR_PEP_ID=MMETSP0328-20130328/1051_1 /TAXON_ID=39455 /ORGANISM="Alexandrium minutum" /LENGTH=271 /DNA_ID=CAMNT_0000787995 /DNA_START=76 /DNA_END=888 /DNA_ORIENTATION=+ /assembly_acc=CAM_ASM_000350